MSALPFTERVLDERPFAETPPTQSPAGGRSVDARPLARRSAALVSRPSGADLLSRRSLSRRPLTSSFRDQCLQVETPELLGVRSALDLGLNVFLTGPAGAGKTTLLRRLEHEGCHRTLVVPAERAPGIEGLISSIITAIDDTALEPTADTGLSRGTPDSGELDNGELDNAGHEGPGGHRDRGDDGRSSRRSVSTRELTGTEDDVFRIGRALRDASAMADVSGDGGPRAGGPRAGGPRDRGPRDEGHHLNVIALDGADQTQIEVLFGRYRDALWELPVNWIVSSRLDTPSAPADAFFDRSITMSPWPAERLAEFVSLRAPELAGPGVDAVLTALAPLQPGQALSAVQSFLMAEDPDDLADRLIDERRMVTELPDRLRSLYDALTSLGPTHASDARLLEEVGVSRSRITHGLKELEDLHLVDAERVGRRVRYRPRLTSLLTGSTRGR